MKLNMNTMQIIHVLSSNPVTEKSFGGVYPIDYLEQIVQKPHFIVCNTDTSEGEEKHWIVIFFSENDVDFFDSLGNNPSEYGNRFIKFMKKFADNCNYSTNRIQPINSDLCGQSCIFFSHKRCQGYDMKYIVNNFPDPNIIKLFAEKYLKTYNIKSENKCQICIKN